MAASAAAAAGAAAEAEAAAAAYWLRRRDTPRYWQTYSANVGRMLEVMLAVR